MATNVLVNLNLQGNQILGLRLEVLAADPAGGALYEGRVWFNSTDDKVKYYNGAAIIPVGIASISDLTVPTADVPWGGFKITGLGNPTAAQDAVTKAYADQALSLLDWKQSVRAASIGNIASLSGPGTVDGVSVIAGDRVLVKGQTTGSANGIYQVNAGAWTRATDFDASVEVTGGAVVYVNEGTVNQNTFWGLINDDPITLGTTALFFTQVNNPGTAAYDLMMQGGSGVLQALVKGANNTVLVVSSGGAVQYALLTNANIDPAAGIALSKLAVDPLARANHTGMQVAATISDFDTQVRTNRLDQMASPSAGVNFGGQFITNLLDPVVAQGAATKAYVDAVAAGLDWKASVRAATTANLAALSAPQTVDGVALIAGDRVLVKNQGGTAANAANGIYQVNAGAWTRTTDADAGAEVTSGLATFVGEGTVNKDTAWVLTTDDPITLGSTALGFSQFSGPGSYTAGNGLALTGTQFSLVSPVAVVDGGTGGITTAAAKTNLGFMTRAAFNSLAATSTACTHNLNTLDVIVEVVEVSTGNTVIADVTRTSVNVVTVTFAVAATAGQYRIVVVG